MPYMAKLVGLEVCDVYKNIPTELNAYTKLRAVTSNNDFPSMALQ